MKDSRLIEILSSFSKAEIKSFGKYINSPYVKFERDVRGLFSIVSKHYPAFQSSLPGKEKMYKALFPGEKYNSAKFANITSELTRLAEEFLIHEYVSGDEFDSARFLALQYRNRKKEKLFDRSIRSLEKKLNELDFDSLFLFTREEKLSRLKQEYHLMRNEFDDAVTERSKYNDYFTLSFLINSFRIMKDREQINNTYATPLQSVVFDTVVSRMDFENIFSDLRKKKYPLLWLLEMYYCCYLCARDLGDKGSFRKFQKLFYAHIDMFSRLEKYYVFGDFTSFCIMNENRGDHSYGREELEIYKQMMKYNAYKSSETDYMSLMLYRNILFLALSLREYKWLDEFIEKYTGKLRPEYVDNMKLFSRAHLDFEKGDFESSLGHISKVKYDFFAYKIDVKNLLLKLFYELELFEQAYSTVDTYRQYLKNNREMPASYKLQFDNFLKLYSRLLKLRTNKKAGDADSILDTVNNEKALSARAWLKEKIEELEK